jgi:uncharacterized oxidoreductase
MPIVSAGALERMSTDLLRAWGVQDQEARLVAQHLVESSLAGVDTHGIMRLPQYLDLVDQHQIDPLAQSTTVADHGQVVFLDGHYAFGPVAAMAGAVLATDRARTHGIALVVVRHVGHTGRIGAYTEHIANEGVLAIAFCSSPIHGHYVSPPGALEGRLATNPISFAFPAPGGPIVADFSTSSIPEGAVNLLRDRQGEAPPDTLLDAQGAPTTDPNSLYSNPPGTILPLGGSRLGHKGFSLGMLVEVMAGTLAGDRVDDRSLKGSNIALLGIDTRLTPTTNGSFDDLAQHLIDYIHSARPIQPDAPILVPGEKEHDARTARSQTGIPVDDVTWQAIAERAHQVGHTMPSVMGEYE